MICQKCNKKSIARIDDCYIKLLHHCWYCDFNLLKKGEISEEKFKQRQIDTLKLKYKL